MTEIEYSKTNRRMKYNPEYHDRNYKPWTKEELSYLCKMYDGTRKQDIALALGRTHSTVLNKAYNLRLNGMFEYYKNLED